MMLSLRVEPDPTRGIGYARIVVGGGAPSSLSILPSPSGVRATSAFS